MPLSTAWPRMRVLPIAGLGALLSTFALTSAPALASTSYGCTNSAQSATVPAGAVSATVNLQGAAGQGNGDGVSGGRGASVNLTMPVTPGQPISIAVGCQDSFGGGGPPGGPSAGNGGGATTISQNGTLFALAGGGGGAGGQDATVSYAGDGGPGGNADGNGTSGTSAGPDAPNYAGQGGISGDSGGQGGQAGQSGANAPAGNGGNGSNLQGGSGGTPSADDNLIGGGGGGGGYIGGGGGGGGSVYNDYDGGGGGGGGSSYVNTGAGATESSVSATAIADGSVTIAYTYTGAVMVSPNPVEFGDVVSTAANSSTQTVTLTDVGSDNDGPVVLGSVQLSGTGSPFAIAGDNCSGHALHGGQSCTVQVTYTPTSGSEGDDTIDLLFPSNSVSGTLTAQLRGTALLAPDMSVLPGL